MSKSVTKRPSAGLGRTPFRNLFPRGVFEDMFDQFLNEPNGELAQMANVSMDVSETDSAFEVKVDLPGIDPEQVDIQVDNNTLTIRGERIEESEEQDEQKRYHRVERYHGSFARSVVLPSSIDESEAAAEFRDGVLRIVIPKTQDAQPRKINITR